VNSQARHRHRHDRHRPQSRTHALHPSVVSSPTRPSPTGPVKTYVREPERP
jgi:hypothetical protein